MSLSYDFFRASLFLCLFASAATASSDVRVINVMDYGAVADGKTDSTRAFHDAWKETCRSEGPTEMQIPEGSYFVGQLKFRGPCRRPVALRVKGTVIATSDPKVFKTTEWIAFHYLNGLLITGGGKFDGRGSLTWPSNNCNKNKNCRHPPTSINFSFVTNGTVEHITSLDSKFFHLHLFECNNMKLDSLRITAPGESPNTDGIHLGNSKNIEISNSVIETGDDCISIGPGDKNISISGIFCGPGHGISVGSLGGSAIEGDVADLSVTNCTFTNTTNGVRIKTWQESPPTRASNFIFDDLVMRSVENPIVIDQTYCPNNLCSNKAPSKVKLSNIKFSNIRGESKSKVAIDLSCSEAVPCEGIELNNIKLKYIVEGEEAQSVCANARGTAVGTVIPPHCL